MTSGANKTVHEQLINALTNFTNGTSRLFQMIRYDPNVPLRIKLFPFYVFSLDSQMLYFQPCFPIPLDNILLGFFFKITSNSICAGWFLLSYRWPGVGGGDASVFWLQVDRAGCLSG